MRVGNKIDWGVKEGKFGGNGGWITKIPHARTHTNPRFGKNCRNAGAGAGKRERKRRKGEQVGGPENFDLFKIVSFFFFIVS